jgi:hypothetical protein
LGATLEAQAVQAALIVMRGITSSLWPIHYKPLPDELLSCWLVRLAHGHGLKVQTFCNLICEGRFQIWNRDIDRLAPSWLLDEISYRTGASPAATLDTTLRAYAGLLFREVRWSGPLPWILALGMYHRKPHGHGLQYCPTCLAEDEIPYFRRSWRVAFHTVCSKHGTMLRDRCADCGEAVAPHRLDTTKLKDILMSPLSYCCVCRSDLRSASAVEPLTYRREVSEFLLGACRLIEGRCVQNDEWGLGRFAVMHQLCRILIARNKHLRLREFVLEQVGVGDSPLPDGRFPIEMLPIGLRHHLMQLAGWVLLDLQQRLTAAWRAGAVRYNVLLKDFPDRPNWYAHIVVELSNWRDRLLPIAGGK